jgi:hypothetical protein
VSIDTVSFAIDYPLKCKEEDDISLASLQLESGFRPLP